MLNAEPSALLGLEEAQFSDLTYKQTKLVVAGLTERFGGKPGKREERIRWVEEPKNVFVIGQSSRNGWHVTEDISTGVRLSTTLSEGGAFPSVARPAEELEVAHGVRATHR